MPSNPVYDYFHQQSVEKVGHVTEVATLKVDQTVEDAVKLLSKQLILSAPVLNAENELVGMIDMLDVANFVLSVVPGEELLTKDHQIDLDRVGRAMALKQLGDIMNASGRDPPVPLNHNSLCSMALSLFASGIHRSPIVNDDDKTVMGILSQSNLVRELNDQIMRGKLKELGERSLLELGLGQAGVISASCDESVLNLIRKLDKNSVSAVGLLNDQGRLMGNFSVTDLRGLWSDLLPSFVLSGRDYLKTHHPSSLAVTSLPVESTTLTQLVKLMNGQKIHRVWCHNKKGELCGVVSMTDLMKLFMV